MDWWDESSFQPSEIDSITFEPSSRRSSSDTLDHKEVGSGRNSSDAQHTHDFDKLGSLRISCVPAQHNSARTGFDKNSTLWCGFVVEQFAHSSSSTAPERTTIYFAGDTGYKAEGDGLGCPAFKAIGEKYGPMDFATIPIWRGGTLNFVSYMGVRVSGKYRAASAASR